ncbi:hypothetical protein KL86DYS2_12285 [uncultured Dysgonomonas sp.]|uniref:Uncharacterized protein n=1 Tax=uncultured Dysgonomonas sp. TaxID=206096 RepID=A0A212JSZ7_9BACT|nr:hypothetical protein KL86DYS2_12285 [uncultured Dysgonomonas sp.]
MYCNPFIIAADVFGFFTSRFNVKFKGIDEAFPLKIEVTFGIEVTERPFDKLIPETVKPEIDL